MFGASTFVYQAKLFDKPRRTEIEISNAGDFISSSMGTKLNDGVAIYGIGYDRSSTTGTWYSGYLISKDETASLTSNRSSASKFTYNGEVWYYTMFRTTDSRDTFEDGIVAPYYSGKKYGSEAVMAILDYYFYKV